jgi:hypothetical protein
MRIRAGLLRGRVGKGALLRAVPTRGGHSTLSPSLALQEDGVDSYRRQIGPVIEVDQRVRGGDSCLDPKRTLPAVN